MAEKELIMYARSTGCPMVSIAKRVLDEHQVPYRQMMIDRDPIAHQRVLDWTGFLSVPTIIMAEKGEDLPFEEPEPLPQGESPRGIDRGPMITEPSTQQLIAWLKKYQLIE